MGSGWYLPAKDELNAVYVNKTAINAALGVLSSAGVSATLLGTSWYWSSSSYDNNDAWYQRFSDGYQYDDYYLKYSRNSVRAVRAF
ncbi:MAG: DUF1566 domain-containing protein [Spirochaetales bacterium]|nr:DUF1566 domain-containing protein [Spirochaetales bacterium]